MTLKGCEIAVVRANRVRREIPRYEQPSDVLLARLTDLHNEPPFVL
jgi:hypothetical protein